jgi:hypothetical protein
MVVTHPVNFFAGWSMVLMAFITGAGIGLFFHRPEFWGGYASFRRRIVRLGHIALAALGMMNVLFALCPWPAAGTWIGQGASWCFIVGGASMPAVCFLCGWDERMRAWFAVPVVALILAVVLTLCGGAR